MHICENRLQMDHGRPARPPRQFLQLFTAPVTDESAVMGPFTTCQPERREGSAVAFRYLRIGGYLFLCEFLSRFVILNVVKDLHLFFPSQPISVGEVRMAPCMRGRTAPTSWRAGAGRCISG